MDANTDPIIFKGDGKVRTRPVLNLNLNEFLSKSERHFRAEELTDEEDRAGNAFVVRAHAEQKRINEEYM